MNNKKTWALGRVPGHAIWPLGHEEGGANVPLSVQQSLETSSSTSGLAKMPGSGLWVLRGEGGPGLLLPPQNKWEDSREVVSASCTLASLPL